MEDKELRELEEFTLEDIIREFSDHPETVLSAEVPEAVETPTEVTEEMPEEIVEAEETPEEPAQEWVDEPTISFAVETAEDAEAETEEDPVPDEPTIQFAVETEQTAAHASVTSDTVRLDRAQILKGVVRNAQPIEEEEETEELQIPVQEEKPAFTKDWEPEYEQPMGEYIPPQPIAFPKRPSSRETKRKLVLGPEKRYYELSERGLGGLQISMLLTLLIVLVSAASTFAYAKGMVPDSRLRLMIFVQFMAVLVSALLGSFQLIQGVADLFKGRFTLNTLLVATFIACAADGVFCLLQERIPCCAAFSLEVLMSLWAEYHRRHAELGQMDVLRKANRLNGVSAKTEGDKTVLVRHYARVEDFMDHYHQVSAPEKRQNRYALIALLVSLAIGGYAAVTQGLYTGIQMVAVSLLAAVPAIAFVATTRPHAILQKRLHRLGTVLCGWQGVEQLSGERSFPVNDTDLFPVGSMRMNGVKFFGSRPTDLVIAYATALVVAEGSALAPVFVQVLDSRNGSHYDAENLRLYEGGGIGGTVLDEPVLVGPLSFLKEMGVEVPEGIQVSQSVCVAIDGELCGLFAISYEKTRSATAGISTLSSYRGLHPVIVAGEFILPESFIRSKFGIKSKRLQFPDEEQRQQLCQMAADEDAVAALIATQEGLAPVAFGITGARALRSACNAGTILHMVGGILGMAVVLTLVILGALQLLTPINMFLYQLVWLIPGWLVTEWTRSI